MGLGGVAIAVLPYVIHPKTAVLGRAGGGELEGDWRGNWRETGGGTGGGIRKREENLNH